MNSSLFIIFALLPPQGGGITLDPWQPDRLKEDLSLLADDSMGGRKTGTPEEAMAAAFVAKRLAEAGAQPLGGSWEHPFQASPRTLDLDATFLEIGENRFTPGKDFLPHPGARHGAAKGPVVFAGYGLRNLDFEYDDFDDLDLEGKVVLVFRWEPQADDKKSPLLGRKFLPETQLGRKVRLMESMGAVAVLVADPPGRRESWQAPSRPYWPKFSRLFEHLIPIIEAQKNQLGLEKTNFSTQDAADQAFHMLQGWGMLRCSIPVAYVSRRVVDKLFKSAGREAPAWVRENDASLSADSFSIPNQASLKSTLLPPRRTGINVVGWIPGSDPELTDSFIVLGAHFDHVGKNAKGWIWNGADDNASGVAALLAVADAFGKSKNPPRRNLVFAAFSGEEIGLVGSHCFVAENLIPAERILAMVNLDMVGRSRNRGLLVSGTRSSPPLREIVAKAAEGLDLVLDFENEEFFDRSDQASFYYEQVPVVFFNTSEHLDYHTPEDTSDRIEYEALTSITILAQRTLSRLDAWSSPLPFHDGYRRLRPYYEESPKLPLPWPLGFDQRIDY